MDFINKNIIFLNLFNNIYNAISQIERKRNQIPQGDNVDVKFCLRIFGSWHPSNDETYAVLDLMDEFQCTISLTYFLDEIDPGVRKILTKATKTWNSLELRDKFSDATLSLSGEFSDSAFKSIVELIIANGGIQRLSLLYSFTLSNESWELFNSHKLGTGREDSTIEFYQPKLSDEVLAQVLENLSGFKILHMGINQSIFPKACRTLVQVLSRPDCEVSGLRIDDHIPRLDFDNNMGGNCICIRRMLETLTTNSSVTELKLDDSSFTDDDLTSIMKQIHKFTHLTTLYIGTLKGSQSLDFLRPLLDNSSLELTMNPSIETLTIFHKDWGRKKQPSKVDYDLLLQVARRYKKLGSVGTCIQLIPELTSTLCMNSKWRQYTTREPELPLSFWRFILQDVEKEPFPNEEQGKKVVTNDEYKAAVVASIRYELVQHIVRQNVRNFMVE